MLLDVMLVSELNSIDLGLLYRDEQRGFAIFVHEVEVDLALDEEFSELVCIFQIMLVVSKQDVKQVRVVGVQNSWVGRMVIYKLYSQFELILKDGPVDNWVLLVARSLNNSLLLWNQNVLQIATHSSNVIVDVDKRLTLFIFT